MATTQEGEATDKMTVGNDDSRESTNRRKSRLVQREMQSRIIYQATALPLVALALLTIAIVTLGRKVISDAAASEIVLPHLELFLIAVVCVAPAMAGAILFVAFRFSHRVAGPAYRIVESLKRVQARDVDFQVSLRHGDFLNELADEMNKTLTVLQTELGQNGTPSQKPQPATDATQRDGQGAGESSAEQPTQTVEG